MSEFDTHPLLLTDTVAIRDVRCEGTCKHKSDEEFVTATHLVFPYRGIYVRHVGRAEATADANQVVFFNEDESYRISHPVDGGDSSLSIAINPATLLELAPAHHLSKGRAAFSRLRLRIDERAQALTALLRHSARAGGHRCAVVGRITDPTAAARRNHGRRYPTGVRAATLASRRRASWMEARVTKVARVSARFSKSWQPAGCGQTTRRCARPPSGAAARRNPLCRRSV
jgi:hypothetical protein